MQTGQRICRETSGGFRPRSSPSRAGTGMRRASRATFERRLEVHARAPSTIAIGMAVDSSDWT
jgi:hypothetical protein